MEELEPQLESQDFMERAQYPIEAEVPEERICGKNDCCFAIAILCFLLSVFLSVLSACAIAFNQYVIVFALVLVVGIILAICCWFWAAYYVRKGRNLGSIGPADFPHLNQDGNETHPMMVIPRRRSSQRSDSNTENAPIDPTDPAAPGPSSLQVPGQRTSGEHSHRSSASGNRTSGSEEGCHLLQVPAAGESLAARRLSDVATSVSEIALEYAARRGSADGRSISGGQQSGSEPDESMADQGGNSQIRQRRPTPEQ